MQPRCAHWSGSSHPSMQKDICGVKTNIKNPQCLYSEQIFNLLAFIISTLSFGDFYDIPHRLNIDAFQFFVSQFQFLKQFQSSN